MEDEADLAAFLGKSLGGTSSGHWQDEKNFLSYLSTLSSYGVDKLLREPSRLSEEKSLLLEQTQNLAFHNYKTFIQTAQCSKDIFADFTEVEDHLETFISELPQLTEECGKFLKKSNQIQASRQQNSSTLSKHSQLLEVLEIPQLMDTCVRNGYYEEALELAQYVRRLEQKHANIPIIMSIVGEVASCKQVMLKQLVQQLRGSIQLAQCLKVVGYLRRMDVFSECELRIKFLQARDSWLQSTVNSISTDDAYYHVTKSMEVTRVNLFEIITQYRAIFSDDDSLHSLHPVGGAEEVVPVERTLFTSYLHHKMCQFLSVFDQDLSRGVGSRLDAVVSQCMYFGLAFSRVGADFRGLIAPIVQRTVVNEFAAYVESAEQQFKESLQSFSFANVDTHSTKLSSAAAAASNHFVNDNSHDSVDLSPPYSLLPFTPLALYCNTVISGFNELRLCLPLSLTHHITSQLHHSLGNITHCLTHLYRSESCGMKDVEVSALREMCEVTVRELAPYINKCLRAFFPPQHLTHMLSCNRQQLDNMALMGHVDVAGVRQEFSELGIHFDDDNTAADIIHLHLPAANITATSVTASPPPSLDNGTAPHITAPPAGDSGQYTENSVGMAADSGNTAEDSGNIGGASGNVAEASGRVAESSANGSEANGNATEVGGNVTEACGNDTEASDNATGASGIDTAASGNDTAASGNNTAASGHVTEASGSVTAASGSVTAASGSVTEDSVNLAEGVAVGSGITADSEEAGKESRHVHFQLGT